LIGSFPPQPSPLKQRIDFALTRIPSLYLAIERHRKWINWDKRVYLSFVKRGDFVWDVGANVGTHAVFLSHLVGSRGKVFAFEPIAKSFAELQQNLSRRLRFPNVSAFEFALGAPDSGQRTVTMLVPGDDFTQAALAKHTAESWHAGNGFTTCEVPFTSLDEQADRLALPRLDFLKIDVEGGELPVISGGRRTISKHHPFIYCEMYDKWERSFNYAPLEIFSLLYSIGYLGARVFHGNRIDAVDPGTNPSPDWFAQSADVLFFGSRHSDDVRRFDRTFSVGPPRRA
jgi:FkbM family methyltransferase